MKLEQAIRIATIAHDEQYEYDKNGVQTLPEIMHPIRVMVSCAKTFNMSEKYLVCAILHDVVEDSDYTLDDLYQLGCDSEQLEIIDYLTRKSDETYKEYIERVSKNKIASQIKYCDLLDNIERCYTESLLQRYITAKTKIYHSI